MERWFVVVKRERVFSNARTTSQKMGWLNPGDLIRLDEDEPTNPYKGWYRFDRVEYGSPSELQAFDFERGYDEWWIWGGAVDEFQGSENDPAEFSPDSGGEISDAQVGAAVRLLVRWVRSLWG